MKGKRDREGRRQGQRGERVVAEGEGRENRGEEWGGGREGDGGSDEGGRREGGIIGQCVYGSGHCPLRLLA